MQYTAFTHSQSQPQGSHKPRPHFFGEDMERVIDIIIYSGLHTYSTNRPLHEVQNQTKT